MSRIYIRMLAVSVFVISVTGAAFSIAGLAKLFAGSAKSVAVMAGALEFAKLVVTGFLYRYWGHIPRVMRGYLTTAVVVLICITSIGIFGYLSAAYQRSALHLDTWRLRLAALEADDRRVLDQIDEHRRFVDGIPTSHVTRKLKFRRESETVIRELRAKSDEIQGRIAAAKLEILNVQTEIGPIIHVAKAFSMDTDTCVRILILAFVFVFDPLAVCLVFALNLAIRLREKYRGNEVSIAAHSLSTPVDHRFKKRA